MGVLRWVTTIDVARLRRPTVGTAEDPWMALATTGETIVIVPTDVDLVRRRLGRTGDVIMIQRLCTNRIR